MFVHPDPALAKELLPGIKKTNLVLTPNLMMVMFEIKAGAEMPLHKHKHEQVGYILAGSFNFTIGGITKELSSGDSYSVKSNILHGATAIKDGKLVDVFYPHREDYYE